MAGLRFRRQALRGAGSGASQGARRQARASPASSSAWLAAALSAGTLAARSLAGISHAAGTAGMIASAVAFADLLAARRRLGLMRALARRDARAER